MVCVSQVPTVALSFCPLLATAGAVTSTALASTATIGHLRRIQTARTAPATSASVRATPTGTTTTASTVKVCAPSLEISASFPQKRELAPNPSMEGTQRRWGAGSQACVKPHCRCVPFKDGQMVDNECHFVTELKIGGSRESQI